MSKSLKNKNLIQRNASRSLLALSLSMSMAAFGCTTDRTLGNGSPVTTPGVRTSPTSTPATGSETAPSVPGSMTSSSSYNAAQAVPTMPRTARNGRVQRLSPEQAAALMAQHQSQPRVRYLGVAYPGGQQSGLGQSATGHQTGQYQNPALITDGRLTVNSSISSAPVPAITDGAGGNGGGGGGAAIGAITEGAFIGGTNGGVGTNAGFNGNAINGNATVNGGAAVFAPTSAAGLSPLGASPGARLPLGTTAAAVTPTTSPTAFSARNPDPTISSFPALGVVNSATRTNTGAALGTGATIANNNAAIANNNFNNNFNNNTINGTGTTANATARATTTNATAGTATGRISPVRVTRDANGRAVITNSTTRNRNQ